MSRWKWLLRAAGVGEAPAQIPSGLRVYAVGDVHGRLDLLDELLALIDCDADQAPPSRNVLILLGDLVDRGPNSAGVVARLLALSHVRADTHFLLGNHEEALLRVLNAEREWLPRWLEFGGAACAASYGVAPSRLNSVSETQGARLLTNAIPPEHVEFLKSFQDTIAIGDYLFVHAGIRPGVAIDSQSQDDLRWIREPFLSDRHPHGVTVVHGHTVVAEPDDRGNRVGIDTGAYYSGRLTALVLEGANRRYLCTG